MTLSEARKKVKEKFGNPLPGKVYNIYKCGHIFLHNDDPLTLRQRRLKTGRHRVCSICGDLFEIKYKKCGCGLEYFGKRVKNSESCLRCYIKPVEPNDRNSNCKKFRNGHLADPERWDCSLREQCLVKFELYDALPCLVCSDYSAAGLRIDDYAMTTKRCA